MMYTYDPSKILEGGRDRMRFELGDVMVENEGEVAALSDEEYDAMLAMYPDRWRKAKIACLTSIVSRFMYEVDTKIDDTSYSLHQRYEAWKKMLDELKAEEAMLAVPSANPNAISPRHYFYEGMHENTNAGGTTTGGGYGRHI